MYVDIIKVFVISTLLRQSFCLLQFKNNVCKHFVDYGTRWVNKNCWYNPDVNSKTPDIILRHGYPLEVHKVVTEDGYILEMFRIPHDNKNPGRKRQPVYIQHGADTDSAVWVDIGNRSLEFFVFPMTVYDKNKYVLAFNLVELGFDVWLGNIRGSTYSQSHVYYHKSHKKFWDFSFHEMAMYDIPAQLDRVATVTGLRGKIIYIGHSMGTTMSYIYSIRRKEHADGTLIGIISLAPVAYLHHLIYLKYVINPNYYPVRFILARLKDLGVVALTPNEENMQKIFDTVCFTTPIQVQACFFLTMLAYGFDSKELQPEDFPLFLAYLTSGWSMKTLQHFIQNTRGPFREFDYGPAENMRRYGTPAAPSYNLSTISLPVHLYFGKHDGLAGEQDVRHLYEDLRTTSKSITPIVPDGTTKFNHIDFMYAKHIKEYLYTHVFARIMKDFKVEIPQ